MNNFIQRSFVGIVLALVNFGVVFSASRLALFGLFVILSSFAIVELFMCLKPEHAGQNCIMTLVANFFFQVFAAERATVLALAAACFYLLALFMLFVVYPTRAYDELFTTLFISLYITFFTSFVYLFPSDKQHYLTLVYAVSWGSDTCAYLGGMAFGKTPLTPISPKKTREGAVSGVLGSVVLCMLFRLFLAPEAPLSAMVVIGILGSLSGQLGDLFASRLKRKMAIKDFGTIFRAHGGVMDRYDSFQFALPVVWLSFGLLSTL